MGIVAKVAVGTQEVVEDDEVRGLRAGRQRGPPRGADAADGDAVSQRLQAVHDGEEGIGVKIRPSPERRRHGGVRRSRFDRG